VPAGSPEVMRAWFYPGNTIGEEFVYPKRRATQLAKASNIVVPATTVDVASADELKTVAIVAVTPDQKDTPVATAIQTVPAPSAARTTGVEETGRSARLNARQLPKTASSLSLIVLVGLGSIAAAFGLMVFGRKSTTSAV
jgi:LPXTG-motif cell wall-anchored protein